MNICTSTRYYALLFESDMLTMIMMGVFFLLLRLGERNFFECNKLLAEAEAFFELCVDISWRNGWMAAWMLLLFSVWCDDVHDESKLCLLLFYPYVLVSLFSFPTHSAVMVISLPVSFFHSCQWWRWWKTLSHSKKNTYELSAHIHVYIHTCHLIINIISIIVYIVINTTFIVHRQHQYCEWKDENVLLSQCNSDAIRYTWIYVYIFLSPIHLFYI